MVNPDAVGLLGDLRTGSPNSLEIIFGHYGCSAEQSNLALTWWP